MTEYEAAGLRENVAALVRSLIARGTADERADAAVLAEIKDEERREVIARTAYELAAQREFAPGQALEDWLAAEAAVEDELRAQRTR